MEYKYSVLTVNTNGYEPVRELPFKNPEVEYVCVTDNPNLKSNTWKIIYTPNIWFLDVKHNVFDYVNSNICLWIDGSYQFLSDPTNEFVMPFINSDKEIAISLHDFRHNIYQECIWWVYSRGMSMTNADAFLRLCHKHNFHSDTLFQTSVILYKKTENTKAILKKVDQISKYCSVDGKYRDDQTIYSYVLAKYAYRWNKILLMSFEHTHNNKFFRWCYHGDNQTMWSKQMSTRCFDKDYKMDELYKIGVDTAIK